ncbi:MAG: hypothetical protein A2Z11_03510 [Candidatus Woykebacteria bacterium RBG_16_43_9]|uniref:Uncharacterized protein n=1 Tax=Candidatus Woykebacteria bacterium RBG_16_43_9 TaxID=1802596 RepID=A0A1G1WCN9_9BACT|nr:MAG: hypothetical protein A2Z11_03510 [Candidatus Woykebacteria bacterium RBG_16_43_9]
MEKKQENKVTDEEIRKLVIERLKTLPSDRKISIGSDGDFSRDQLITAVEKENDVGRKIIDVQLEFLRSLKEGILPDE